MNSNILLVSIVFILSSHAFATGVCDRTQAVKETLEEVFYKPCQEITTADLNGFKSVLKLGNKNIQSLKVGDFEGLTSLHQIWLSKNKLQNLPVGIFKDLSSLTHLYLEGNQFTTLPEDMFKDLTHLKLLQLSGNPLITLPDQIFKGVPLVSVDLSRAALKELPENLFQNNPNLKWIYLYKNQLKNLRPNTFKNLTSLEELDLNDNQLTQLPDGIFRDLRSLSSVDFTRNQLANLSAGVFDHNNFNSTAYVYFDGNPLTAKDHDLIDKQLGRRGQY